MSKIISAITDVRKYWNVPKEGNYVPNKEIVAFSGGGIGVKTIGSINTYIQMTATCLLMGAVYGLSPSQLMVLFLINNIIGIIKTPFISWLVDNTNTRMGKFRPYLLWTAAPCILAVIGITWFIPVDGSATAKMVLIAVFYNIYIIGQQLNNNAYVGLSQVISPSSGERNKIMSISEFIANLGPSIVQLVLPIFAQIFFGSDGLLKLETYRILMPLFSVIGIGLGLIVMFNTKERVILPRNDKAKISFIDGLKLAGKNADLWIVSISKFFEGFRTGIALLLSWICLYQLNSSSMYGILVTIVSTAFVPGMLLAPLLMKKLGSGKAAFLSFSLNMIAAIIMLLTFKSGVVFFVIALYIFNFASGPQYIMQNSITADALDEIQLQSKERVEGFAQNFQLMFLTIGGLVANFLFMLVYEFFGLVEGADGLTDYSILRDAAVREPIITYVIVIGMAAAMLSAIPYRFIRMTTSKHNEIIKELEAEKLIAEKEEQPKQDLI